METFTCFTENGKELNQGYGVWVDRACNLDGEGQEIQNFG
jgi:hypothetical protein